MKREATPHLFHHPRNRAIRRQKIQTTRPIPTRRSRPGRQIHLAIQVNRGHRVIHRATRQETVKIHPKSVV